MHDNTPTVIVHKNGYNAEHVLLIAVENSGGKWGTKSSGYPLVGSPMNVTFDSVNLTWPSWAVSMAIQR
jgi:hypothetical protein